MNDPWNHSDRQIAVVDVQLQVLPECAVAILVSLSFLVVSYWEALREFQMASLYAVVDLIHLLVADNQ